MITTAATRYWCGNGTAPLIREEKLAGAKYGNGMPGSYHCCSVNIEYVSTSFMVYLAPGYGQLIK